MKDARYVFDRLVYIILNNVPDDS